MVASGLLSLAAGLAWASTGTTSTSYGSIAGSMILIGSGIGLTSAPATESIMGAVPAAKAGVGSAINDATRILGGTLGVAVIGSIYASLYASHLAEALPAGLPGSVTDSARRSVGIALGAADRLDALGRPGAARALHDAATSAFFDGFQTAVLVAAGVALGGMIVALALIPNQPPTASIKRADFLPGQRTGANPSRITPLNA